MKSNHRQYKNILIINPGSSSVKWSWFASRDSNFPEKSGAVKLAKLDDLFAIIQAKLIVNLVIVRFVHGGSQFCLPLLITPQSLTQLSQLDEYSPLHNPLSVWCAKQVMQQLQPEDGIVAVFDTEFFVNLPKVARTYAIPFQLTKKYAIKRYGFHGFAHSAMYSQWLESIKRAESKGQTSYRVVTIQLGAGCSMAAILDCQPIDTSMGFTPNEGLIMATRCGDIDPGLLTWLQRKEGWDPDETDRVLNSESGWFGVSSESANIAELIFSQSAESQLAIEILRWRLRKLLGGYFALLGGLDGVILSGGIAEKNAQFCSHLLSNLNHLGIELRTLEDASHTMPIRISSVKSKVSCYIVENKEPQAMLASVIKSSLLSNKVKDENDVSYS